MNNYDVIIAGAGPAGLAAALTLRNSELKVALIDKATFPREKICGDGLCDRSINTIRAISEDYYSELLTHNRLQPISNALLGFNSSRVKLSMPMFGYTMPRLEFDNFLMEKVKADAHNVEVLDNTKVLKVEKNENSVIVYTNSGELSTPLLIVANGFKSHISQQLSGYMQAKETQAIGIRAYYKNVCGTEHDTVEFHLNKKYFPGYLWIFPMKDNIANVGYGYHLDHKIKSEKAPKDLLQEWIESDSKLSERFKGAEKLSAIKGTMIPVSEMKFDISGDNYMLSGDAASLVDPITGGGIGNGLLSGHFAALQSIQCHKQHDFSLQETIKYQERVVARMKKDITFRFKAREIITKYPVLLNIFFALMKFENLRKRLIIWHTGTKKK